MIGSTVSHYKILSKLGQGGMGVVYKAEDLRLNRLVALKFLPPESLSETQKQRFLQEARTAALLNHPNICPIFDVGESDGKLFFAMAFIEGKTLPALMNGQPQDIDTAVNITLQLLNGLEEAHKRGVIHRDMKGNNIVITSQGNAYILDFGLALRDGHTRLTEGAGILGTPSYMSPEQAQGLPVDHRTDLWSVGVVLYEMLTGRVPFRREQDWAVVHGIIHDPLPPIRALRPELPESMQRVVEIALAKNPDERWQSAQQFAAQLRLARGGVMPSKAANATTVVLHSRSPSTPAVGRRNLITGAAVVAVGAVGYGVWKNYFSTPIPMEKHIAVLPFNVIGNNELVHSISDGLVESLTAKLSQLEPLLGKVFVIPASEIRARKITSAEQAHRIYGATLVITGSALLTNNLIEFTVSLIDPVKMRTLDAKSFDFDAKDPIALRDGALNNVMALLQLPLTQAAKTNMAEGETTTPVAYEEYLKGTGYLARYDIKGNLDKSIESFHRAIEKDQRYALAYAGLGNAYTRKSIQTAEKHWQIRAIEYGEKAVQLAPSMGLTHSGLGRIYQEFGKEDAAIAELQKALQLNPGDAEAYRSLATVQANRGKLKEAEELYLDAIARRPGDWFGHLLLGRFYMQQSRSADAEASFKRALSITPDNEIMLRTLGGFYSIMGRYREARELLLKVIKTDPTARSYSGLGMVYLDERRFQEAATALEAARDLDSSAYTIWGNLGIVYSFIPEKKHEAQKTILRAVELGNRLLEVTPKNYRIRLNLAEYYAHLKQKEQAQEQLKAIPEAVHNQYLTNFILVYELIGQRSTAIRYFNQLASESSVKETKNDPFLQTFWNDPVVQSIVEKKWRGLK